MASCNKRCDWLGCLIISLVADLAAICQNEYIFCCFDFLHLLHWVFVWIDHTELVCESGSEQNKKYFCCCFMLHCFDFWQNLDVNQAVNNLLSRDDEGEVEDDDSQDSYMPDDLISLLDGGMHSEHPSVIIDADTMYNEDVFGYSTLRSRASSTRPRLGQWESQGIYLLLKKLNVTTVESLIFEGLNFCEFHGYFFTRN